MSIECPLTDNNKPVEVFTEQLGKFTIVQIILRIEEKRHFFTMADVAHLPHWM
jgi:hypothetical protein